MCRGPRAWPGSIACRCTGSSRSTRSPSMRASRAALAVVLLVAGTLRAEPDREERARAHFEAGRVQYNLGDYKGAVREFAEGYRLVPRPQFLVNLGQAYRRLGQLERAREMYNRFLA